MSDRPSIDELLRLWEHQGVPAEELCHAHPELLSELRLRIQASASNPTTCDSPNQVRVSKGSQTPDGQEPMEPAVPSGSTSEQDGNGNATAGSDPALTFPLRLEPTIDHGWHSPSSTPTPAPEEREQNRFRPVRFLGKGGFGEVWQARDLVLGRDVALKRPRQDQVSNVQEQDRFLAEARKIAGLRHANIVPIYDVWLEGQTYYLVYELIEGSTLAKELAKRRFSFQESARLVSQVAAALDFAHANDTVHRDVKPGNILLDRKGHAYLADFGLAVSEEEQLRENPAVVGTRFYMSPEQARGESNMLDGRSDLFSLGVVFYELLTGRRPFIGTDGGDFFDRLVRQPPRPPRTLDSAVPEELERICLKCLAKDPTQRYTTAGDLQRELQAWLDADAKATSLSLPSRMGSATRQADLAPLWSRPRFRIGAAITLSCALFLVVFFFKKQALPAPKNGPFNPDEVGVKPGVWYPLLDWEPRPLYMPGAPSKVDWEQGKPAWIHSHRWALIAFGEAKRPGYKIRLRYKQTPWQDEVFGVFFGLHEGKWVNPRGEPKPAHWYQMVILRGTRNAGNREWIIMRSICRDSKPGVLGNPVYTEQEWQTVPFPDSNVQELEFTVSAAGLHDVYWNRNLLPGVGLGPFNEKILAEDPKALAGPFGIRIGESSAYIESFDVQYLPAYFEAGD